MESDIEGEHLIIFNSLSTTLAIPNNKIWYTTSDGNSLVNVSADKFSANFVSQSFDGEKWIAVYDDDVCIINSSAFRACSTLTSVTIPASVIAIGENAFKGCSALASVTIPASVIAIGNYAFGYCSSLISVTSLGTTAPEIQSSTFRNVAEGGVLHYPANATGYDNWLCGYDNWTASMWAIGSYYNWTYDNNI